MRPLVKASRQDWATFFRNHCAALFETALLLTADPDEAEASVAAVIEQADTSTPPDEIELANLQIDLARRAVQKCGTTSFQLTNADRCVREGLRPVLQIDRYPRICFVLRMLLGYTTSTCARELGLEEAAVKGLLRVAILQLQSAVVANDSSLREFQNMGDQVVNSSLQHHG